LSHSSTLFFLIIPRTPRSTLFPYTTLFRSEKKNGAGLTSPVSGFSLFTPESELRDQILPCRINEITSEYRVSDSTNANPMIIGRSEEHTSELQSRGHLVCRLLLEKKKQKNN